MKQVIFKYIDVQLQISSWVYIEAPFMGMGNNFDLLSAVQELPTAIKGELISV